MRKVEIGTSEFTEVFATDEPEFNANHQYSISTVKEPSFIVAKVSFQRGPIKENSANGCHHEDLIAIVLDRLYSFQASDYKCRENALAITKFEEGLMWLRKRTDDRKVRGVEGTSTV